MDLRDIRVNRKRKKKYLAGYVTGEPIKSLVQALTRCSTSALDIPENYKCTKTSQNYDILKYFNQSSVRSTTKRKGGINGVTGKSNSTQTNLTRWYIREVSERISKLLLTITNHDS